MVKKTLELIPMEEDTRTMTLRQVQSRLARALEDVDDIAFALYERSMVEDYNRMENAFEELCVVCEGFFDEAELNDMTLRGTRPSIEDVLYPNALIGSEAKPKPKRKKAKRVVSIKKKRAA